MKWRSASLWVLGIVVVALMVYRFRAAFFDAIGTLSAEDGLAWLLLTLGLRLLLAYGFAISVRHAGGNVSLRESFLLGWVRSFFNQLIPFSGTAANVIYMNRVLNLNWGQIGSLGTPLFIIALQATFFVGAVAFAGVIPLLGWPAASATALLFGSAILMGRLGVEHLLKVAARAFPFTTKWIRADSTLIHEFSGQVRNWLMIVFCLAALLRFLRLLVLFSALGLNVPIISVFFISAMADVSSVVQLTPGGLGIRELLIFGVGIVVGGQTDGIAAIALIDRAFTIGAVVVFGALSILLLRQKSVCP